MADSNLQVSVIDFFKIKQTLIAYLKNQNQFTDFNFSGSGWDVILDILCYNTFYQAVYGNFAIAETFLDSAVQRGSVVSAAKELGYVPRSIGGANATITVSFSVSGNPAEYIIPKNTLFNSANSVGSKVGFTTSQDYNIVNNGSNVFTGDIEIFQGIFNTFQYTVNLNDASQRFIIPSKNADLSFLVVNVAPTNAGDFVQYQNVKETNIGTLDGDSEVFFVKEAFDGFYEVYFGDGIVGKELNNGNVVQLTFLITQGETGNDISQFVLGSTLAGTSNFSIVTVEGSSGGASQESIDSVKFLAPLYYQAQERAVTEDDYIALFVNTIPGIQDVKVWGGEKNIPPYYGKVFIAAATNSGNNISTSMKLEIENSIISKFNIVGIRPTLVDPTYIDVKVDVTASYNGKILTQDSSTLSTSITEAISDFFDASVNKFGKTLYFSKLVSTINAVSSLLLSTTVNLTLTQNLIVAQGSSTIYTYNFNNALHPGSIFSNQFVIDGITWQIKDVYTDPLTSTGTLVVYRNTNSGVVYLTESGGTVNYNTGLVTVAAIRIDSLVVNPIDNLLSISASPGAIINTDNVDFVYRDFNVYTNGLSQIIKLDSSTVTLVADNSL